MSYEFPMHEAMYRAYSDLIPKTSGSVLEVGAIPSDKSLLCLPQLKDAERVGLNLDGPHKYGGFEIVRGNGNEMPFESDRFDLVLCNAVIEHDPYFWKTVSEAKRVTKPGGTIIFGAPGYRQFPTLERWQGRAARIFPKLANGPRLNAVFRFTPVFQVHNEPGDYYRFSDQAFREVIMAGLDKVSVQSVMIPPRLIGIGVKPPAGQ